MQALMQEHAMLRRVYLDAQDVREGVEPQTEPVDCAIPCHRWLVDTDQMCCLPASYTYRQQFLKEEPQHTSSPRHGWRLEQMWNLHYQTQDYHF